MGAAANIFVNIAGGSNKKTRSPLPVRAIPPSDVAGTRAKPLSERAASEQRLVSPNMACLAVSQQLHAPFTMVGMEGSAHVRGGTGAPMTFDAGAAVSAHGDKFSNPEEDDAFAFRDPRNSRNGLALGTGNILMRHMQVWIREDDAPGHDLPTVKEYIAKLLASNSSAEGMDAVKFVKGAAARIDNDQENPLLFIRTVKTAVDKLKGMLLSPERRAKIDEAAAGGLSSANMRVKAGLRIAPDSFDREGTVHTAVEYACVRPLLGRIMSIARQAAGDKEVFLQTKIQKLKQKEATEYFVDHAAEMKAKLRGRNWSSAIELFNILRHPMLPSQVG
jgi:hypothetical protein